MEARRPYVEAHRADLDEVLAEQAAVVQSLWEQTGRADVFDHARWNRELHDRLFTRNKLTATDFGHLTAKRHGTGFDPSELDPFLDSSAKLSAENINATTDAKFRDAAKVKDAAEAVAGVFGVLLGSRLDQIAQSNVTTSSSFGMTDAARQGGLRRKTWLTTSGNPRASHALVDGETVDLDELFSNGLAYPGDPAGGADEVAGCDCSIDFEE